MKKSVKILTGVLFLMLVVAAVVMVKPMNLQAAKKAVKLSKTTLTFASPDASPQTVKIKNVKASNIKDITIDNSWEEWLTIERKGKNKLVVTPKRSSGEITYGVSIRVEYKKPVNGQTSSYLQFEKIMINGNSRIPIKTAEDLCNIRANSYEYYRWQYVLENDIDMTGKGVVKNPWEYGTDRFYGIYLDGQGHTIKSDTPVFAEVGGVVKNIVFDMNINTTISKNDAAAQIWSEYAYNQTYGGLAPIIYNHGLIEKCKATGSITVNLDKKVTYALSDGTPTDMTYHNVAGLVEINQQQDAIIKNCISDMNITVTESNDLGAMIYVGGLAAENYGYSGNNASIIESQFSGKIAVKDASSFIYAGGINSWGNGDISDCLNTGTVTSDRGSFDWAAGICGEGGTSVKRVLTTGTVNYGLFGKSISEESLAYDILPEYEDAYYLKSKSDGFNVLGNPFEVPGTKGISDSELTNQATFTGFDFENVWKMGTNGPELRNLP